MRGLRTTAQALFRVPLGSTLVTVWRWIFTCTPFAISTVRNCSAGLGDLAEDAAGGDDFVADAERGDHGLVLLGALGLRPDQQEIEHDEDQHQRQHLQQRVRLARRGRLGVGARNQPVHRELLSPLDRGVTPEK